MSRKNVYIITIVTCFLGTAGVLYYGFFRTSTGTAVPLAPTVVVNPVGQTQNPSKIGSTPGRPITSGSPAVFPADSKFDWTLLDSPTFKSLVAVPDLIADPSQVGRSNPFASK